jgi:hypothetical protein
MRRLHCTAVLSIMILALAGSAYGQAQVTGRIAGVVSDSSKGLIPGVNVQVESSSLFSSRATLTAENGSYFFDNLALGVYKVLFTFPGFKTVVREDVNVRENFTATINVSMEVGAVEQTVEVQGAAPAVDVRSETTATTFDTHLMNELPTGRDTWSTLAQVPGLSPSKFDVGGSESYQQTSQQVHGSKIGQSVYSYNGLKLNYPGGTGGSTAFYADDDSFGEVQVTTDAAQAEIGVGGVYINQITKRGSNDVHGMVLGNYTTAALTSPRSKPLFAGKPVETGTTITMMRDNTVQLGLPIIRNRFWLFNAYRRYDIDLAVPTIKRADGSAIKDDNHQTDISSRADISISPRQQLSLIWLYNSINRFYRRPGTYAFEDEDASRRQIEPAWVGQIQWTYTPTTSLVLESRFGNMTLHFPLDYQPNVKPGTINVQDTVLSTSKYAATDASINSTWHVRGSETASYYAAGILGGSHNVRGGFEYAMMRSGNKRMVYRDLNVVLANGQPLYAVLYNTPIHSEARANETGAFLQDSYVLRRLTINAGFRFDRLITWNPAQTSAAGTWVPERSFPRSPNIVNWNNISPRLGISYDVTGQGKTALHASFGRSVLLDGVGTADTVNPNGLSSVQVPFTSLAPDNYPLGLGTPIFRTGGNVTRIDSNLTRPYSDQAAAGFEHQLIGDLRVGAEYFYRHLKNDYGRRNMAALPSDYSPIQTINPLTNQPMTIYNLAQIKVGLADYLITNIPEVDNNAYHGLEVTATKRFSRNWQLLSGFTVSRWKGTFTNGTSDDFNNPNRGINRTNAYLQNDATYVYKVAGTYNFPKGITASSNFQHYTGYPIAPSAVFTSGLNQRTETITVQTRGVERLPSLNELNARFGYNTHVSERIRMQPAVDIYNLFNSNAYTAIVQTVGPNYKKPSTALGQRFVRFGLRIEF